MWAMVSSTSLFLHKRSQFLLVVTACCLHNGSYLQVLVFDKHVKKMLKVTFKLLLLPRLVLFSSFLRYCSIDDVLDMHILGF